jgi:hypothetical protein
MVANHNSDNGMWWIEIGKRNAGIVIVNIAFKVKCLQIYWKAISMSVS